MSLNCNLNFLFQNKLLKILLIILSSSPGQRVPECSPNKERLHDENVEEFSKFCCLRSISKDVKQRACHYLQDFAQQDLIELLPGVCKGVHSAALFPQSHTINIKFVINGFREMDLNFIIWSFKRINFIINFLSSVINLMFTVFWY